MSIDTMKKFQEEREQEIAEHFATCERIRKKLELPVDALKLIDRALRGESGIRAAAAAARFASRAPLRLASEAKIKKTDPITGKATAVHVRPQVCAMRVEQIEILGRSAHWMIADIQVGHRSQFPHSGPPIPGHLFVPSGTCHQFVTETIQTAMDFTMLVHYVGPESEGDIFEAVAMGSMAL